MDIPIDAIATTAGIAFAITLGIGWLGGNYLGWRSQRKLFQYTTIEWPFNWRIFLGHQIYFQWLARRIVRPRWQPPREEEN